MKFDFLYQKNIACGPTQGKGYEKWVKREKQFCFSYVIIPNVFSHKLMNWRRPLDTVLGRQPLLERNWELVRKLCPSLISHLGFEPVQDFVKHVLQFRMRVLPRGDGVTKVDEVLHHSWKKVTRNF